MKEPIQRTELEDLLIRLSDYFEDRQDADDGVPNEEMHFKAEIDNILNNQS